MNINTNHSFRLLILLLIFPTSLYAANDKVSDELIKRVQQTYSTHNCFKAYFDQLTVNVAMDITDKFQGVMYVQKPGMIVLDVDEPERQKVVIQGRSYTVYFPNEGSASTGEVPPELNIEHFFGFFANIGSMSDNFSFSEPSKRQELADDLVFLELTDKKHQRSDYSIIIGVDKTDHTIRRAIIYDALGNYNRFDLKGIKFLDSLPESVFQTPSMAPRP
jgi:outer membrane lipoprotein-sorting protein